MATRKASGSSSSTNRPKSEKTTRATSSKTSEKSKTSSSASKTSTPKRSSTHATISSSHKRGTSSGGARKTGTTKPARPVAPRKSTAPRKAKVEETVELEAFERDRGSRATEVVAYAVSVPQDDAAPAESERGKRKSRELRNTEAAGSCGCDSGYRPADRYVGHREKGFDVQIIDVVGRVDCADFIVVASGRSDRHVSAIVQGIEEDLKKAKTSVLAVEGLGTATWVLVDVGDVIAHIFQSQCAASTTLKGCGWTRREFRLRPCARSLSASAVVARSALTIRARSTHAATSDNTPVEARKMRPLAGHRRMSAPRGSVSRVERSVIPTAAPVA
ncbi:MAG: ribosome silencing factor [Polyangiaceae bacterium]